MPSAWAMRAATNTAIIPPRAQRLPPESSSAPMRIKTNGAFSMKLDWARIRLSSGSCPPSPTLTFIFLAKGGDAPAEPEVEQHCCDGAYERDRNRCHANAPTPTSHWMLALATAAPY